MSVIESVLVAMFCLALVFVVLIILYVMVLALSKAISILLKRKTAVMDNEAAIALPGNEDWDVEAVHASSGELSLMNVDEKTAAMIMAIVSDESRIPLSELRFKSIRAID